MAPTVIAFAPGRVELLGNHTDYNDGVALAAPIYRGVTIRAEKLDADLVEISSEANGREVRVSLKNLQRLDEERWANYPIGVIKTLREAGFEIGGMRLRVGSNLTPGSGLSSSAAFYHESFAWRSPFIRGEVTSRMKLLDHEYGPKSTTSSSL